VGRKGVQKPAGPLLSIPPFTPRTGNLALMQLGTRRLHGVSRYQLVLKRRPSTATHSLQQLQLRGRQHHRGALPCRFPSDITDTRAAFTTTKYLNMTTFQFKFKPDDTSYDDGAVFSTIQPFLEGRGDATLAGTAKSIAATLPGPPDERGSDEHYSLYNLFIDVAKQIPYDEPALVRLVGVVEQLSQSPKTTLKETTVGAAPYLGVAIANVYQGRRREAQNPPHSRMEPPRRFQP
jgi:hypothetical protein